MVALARGTGAAMRDHEAEGELGDGDGVGAGGVHDDDAAAGGLVGVDVVDAHAGAADDAEFGRGGEECASAWTAERTMRASASARAAGRPPAGIWSAVTTFQPGSFWKMARVAGETFSARTIFTASPESELWVVSSLA